MRADHWSFLTLPPTRPHLSAGPVSLPPKLCPPLPCIPTTLIWTLNLLLVFLCQPPRGLRLLLSNSVVLSAHPARPSFLVKTSSCLSSAPHSPWEETCPTGSCRLPPTLLSCPPSSDTPGWSCSWGLQAEGLLGTHFPSHAIGSFSTRVFAQLCLCGEVFLGRVV